MCKDENGSQVDTYESLNVIRYMRDIECVLGVLPQESRSALLTYTNAIPIQECCMDDT